MKLNRLFALSFKSILNKTNIIFIIFMTLLGTACIFGFSYYLSIKDYWYKTLNNSYYYNLVLASIEESKSLAKVKNSLRKNEHVKDVFEYSEFMWGGKILDYISDDFDGTVTLVGTINNTKKIMYGKDLNNDKTYELICPSIFYPDYYLQNGYDLRKGLNLKETIGKELTFKYMNQFDIKFKLVGLYDITYDFSEPNFCYVSHATLKEMNKKYQPNLDNNSNLFILLDDISNVNKLSEDEIYQINKVKTLNQETGTNVLIITNIAIAFLIVMSLFLGNLIYSRKLMSEFKNIGIMLMVGYSKTQVKQIKYFEAIITGVFSFILSLILSHFISLNFVNIFLWNDPQLSLINISLYPISIVLAFFLIINSMIITSNLSLKKIDRMDIQKIIYE